MKINYTTSSGIPIALSDMYFDDDCDVYQIQDVIEDSADGKEMGVRLNKLKLCDKWKLDREKGNMVRLKSTDLHGNIRYLVVAKD